MADDDPLMNLQRADNSPYTSGNDVQYAPSASAAATPIEKLAARQAAIVDAPDSAATDAAAFVATGQIGSGNAGAGAGTAFDPEHPLAYVPPAPTRPPAGFTSRGDMMEYNNAMAAHKRGLQDSREYLDIATHANAYHHEIAQNLAAGDFLSKYAGLSYNDPNLPNATASLLSQMPDAAGHPAVVEAQRIKDAAHQQFMGQQQQDDLKDHAELQQHIANGDFDSSLLVKPDGSVNPKSNYIKNGRIDYAKANLVGETNAGVRAKASHNMTAEQKADAAIGTSNAALKFYKGQVDATEEGTDERKVAQNLLNQQMVYHAGLMNTRAAGQPTATTPTPSYVAKVRPAGSPAPTPAPTVAPASVSPIP